MDPVSPRVFVPVQRTAVADHRGSPTLFVNGLPHPGLTFFFGRVLDSDPDIRSFAAAGIDLFSGCFGLSGLQRDDGSWDFAPVRERFDYVLRANPHALILPRIGLNHIGTQGPRFERYRDQLQVDIDARTGRERTSGSFSFSSELWRQEFGAALDRFIRFLEAEYGEHILGYHLGAGAAGEWAYGWENQLSDYSQPQRRAFQRWLSQRYGGDVAALRRAWNRPDAEFGAADIPRDRQREPGQLSLFDPEADRPAIDYLTFHSEAVAAAIAHFCRITKNTLRSLGREKICGVFHGYHFKNPNRPANFMNEGHFAGGPVLASPDIDFLCAPYCYSGREHGNMYVAQLLSGSTRLHGKLHWCEDDTFTFLSRRQHGRSWCPDVQATIGVLQRNLVGILREGGTAWYMDCGGNGPLQPGGQVDGWYRDERLMQAFAQMQRIAGDRLDRPDLSPTAQVAVFLGDASTSYLRQDVALIDPLVFRQAVELGALGAAFDAYRVEDLPRLFEQPWSANYRLLIFLDTLYVSTAQRAAIERHAKRDGRTLLWVHAPGLATDASLSVESVQQLTGLRLAMRRQEEALLVNAFLTGARILYGAERPISPVLVGADPEAAVGGWFLNTGDDGLLQRDFGDWRSVWSGAPAVPAAILRHIARQAGVHLYVETGEQVLADNGLLALHAAFDGPRTVRLPVVCDVSDAITGQPVAARVREFSAGLRRGQTGLWTLRPVCSES